jgi:hypothetical protein
MNIYTSTNFRIGLASTKILFKIKNLNTGQEFKININDIKKAYQIKENIHFNKEVILNRVLYFLNKDLGQLDNKVKSNKKQFEAIKKLQCLANGIKEEFFNEYYLLSMFKNTLGI